MLFSKEILWSLKKNKKINLWGICKNWPNIQNVIVELNKHKYISDFPSPSFRIVILYAL